MQIYRNKRKFLNKKRVQLPQDWFVTHGHSFVLGHQLTSCENALYSAFARLVVSLPTKHIGVHMNSFKRVRAFQIELEFGSVGF